MPWVRIDDDFFNHRKVLELSLPAKTVFIAGLCHCNSQLTDGFVSAGAARSIVGSLGAPQKVLKELVDAGMWHKRGDGFDVHDYLHYQPPAKQILEERAKAKERMRSVRSRRRSEGSSPEQGTLDLGVRNANATGRIALSRNGVHDAAEAGSRAPSSLVDEPDDAQREPSVPPEQHPELRGEVRGSPTSHSSNSQSSVTTPRSRPASDDDDRREPQPPGDTPDHHGQLVEQLAQRDLAARLEPDVVDRKGPIHDADRWLQRARRRHADRPDHELEAELQPPTNGPHVPDVDETRRQLDQADADHRADLEQTERCRQWLERQPDHVLADLNQRAEAAIRHKPGPARDALVDAKTLVLADQQMRAES